MHPLLTYLLTCASPSHTRPHPPFRSSAASGFGSLRVPSLGRLVHGLHVRDLVQMPSRVESDCSSPNVLMTFLPAPRREGVYAVRLDTAATRTRDLIQSRLIARQQPPPGIRIRVSLEDDPPSFHRLIIRHLRLAIFMPSCTERTRD